MKTLKNIENTETNLIFFDIDPRIGDGPTICRQLSENGVLSEALDPQRIRFVTHLGVSKIQVEEALDILKRLCV